MSLFGTAHALISLPSGLTLYAPRTVTGASRGIGFALVEQLAKRDNVLIFAGARNPATSDQLNALVKSLPEGKLYVVKLDSVSDEDAEAAARFVREKTDKVDVLIANAGESG